jgi:hypothetical protein
VISKKLGHFFLSGTVNVLEYKQFTSVAYSTPPFLFHVDSNFLLEISGLKMFARDIELSNDKIVSIMQQPEVGINVTFRVMQTMYSWVPVPSCWYWYRAP